MTREGIAAGPGAGGEASAEDAKGLSPRERIAWVARSDTGRAAGLAGAVIASNAIGLVFTIVFARLLGASDYGSLAALVSAFLILAVPGSALQITVAREVSAAVAAGDPAPTAGVRRWTRDLAILTAVAALASIALREQIAAAIGVDFTWAAAAAIPTGCLWLILSVQRGALQALQRYRLVGLSVVAEAAARLAFGLLLVGAGLDVTGAYLGTGLSLLATSLALAVPLGAAGGSGHGAATGRLRDLVARTWAPLLGLALIGVLQEVHVIVVKHAASAEAAGSYAVAAVAAKAIIWVAVGLALYLLPEAARRSRMGLDARPVLAQTLVLLIAAGAPMVGLYALAGEPVLRLVFGDDLTRASDALPVLGAAMTVLAVAYLAMQYLLALGRARFILVLASAAAAELALLSSLGPDLGQIALGLLSVLLFAAVALVVLGFRSVARPVAAD